ncbi:hypothetical protein PP182_04295 [Maribacter sp. PR1]|uniref:Lipid/polyisoprenoid-binding YceI-like domain-containing protein n=1 Tax=Maribacter cobaltidurans TaxID=1178778 RepID=A0ABU7IQN3_9FLAO|nr:MULTISPECIES: hypothetical protein [Maribacter]MDC6387885.1 hypothetical protein [Maribacter sp. PR1]MEE1975274.1 hypothetical protein [Maribacter cobaltidurans]
MKTLKPILLLSLAFAFMGCDLIDELVDEEYDVNVSFNRFIHIDVQPTGNPEEAVGFMESAVINLTNAPELDEFREENDRTEVKAIKINRIRYFYKDVAGNENAFVEAEFQIPLIVTSPDIFGAHQVNLADAATNPNPYVIDGDFTNINGLLNEVRGFNTLQLDYVGSVSDNPIEFTVDVTIDATLTLEIQI